MPGKSIGLANDNCSGKYFYGEQKCPLEFSFYFWLIFLMFKIIEHEI